MVVKSPYPDIPIPEVDLLTYLFSDGKKLSDEPIWVNSADSSQFLSLQSVLPWIKRLGLGLQKLGLNPGDVVMLVSPNHIFVPVAYLGVAGFGFIFSGASPMFTVDELAFQIKNSGARIVLAYPTLLSTTRKAAKQAGLLDASLFLFSDKANDAIDGIKDWRSMAASPEEAALRQWPRLSGPASKQQVATINYSSGTTGLPKGVMITHYNLIANTEQVMFHKSRKISEAADSTQGERLLGLLPLYHAYGQQRAIMMGCKERSPVFIMTAFDIEEMLRVIQTHKVTHLPVAPPILVLLSKHPAVAKYDLTSLRYMISGGAPLSASLQNECQKRFDIPIGQGWGMTEITCAGLVVPQGDEDDSGAVGTLLSGCEAKLLDDDGREVGPGERGELFVRGPNTCPGYWQNETATKESMLADGWLRTGDIAVYDENGKFWIVDRAKELIKVSGLQVAPAELEAVLLTHPAIADAGVIGMAESFGAQEKVRAYVQLKQKGSTSSAKIEEWMKEQVAKHKWLTAGVVFVDTVPKSAAGKIQRKVMREWAKTETRQARAKM